MHLRTKIAANKNLYKQKLISGVKGQMMNNHCPSNKLITPQGVNLYNQNNR